MQKVLNFYTLLLSFNFLSSSFDKGKEKGRTNNNFRVKKLCFLIQSLHLRENGLQLAFFKFITNNLIFLHILFYEMICANVCRYE